MYVINPKRTLISLKEAPQSCFPLFLSFFLSIYLFLSLSPFSIPIKAEYFWKEGAGYVPLFMQGN